MSTCSSATTNQRAVKLLKTIVYQHHGEYAAEFIEQVLEHIAVDEPVEVFMLFDENEQHMHTIATLANCLDLLSPIPTSLVAELVTLVADYEDEAEDFAAENEEA